MKTITITNKVSSQLPTTSYTLEFGGMSFLVKIETAYECPNKQISNI